MNRTYLRVVVNESIELTEDQKMNVINDINYMIQDLKDRRHSIEFYRIPDIKMKRYYKDQYERVKVILSSDYKDILNLMYIFIFI